jgi:hypothetical protein
MKTVLAFVGFATFVGFGLTRFPERTAPARAAAQVMLHCPAGDSTAFVTPRRVTIAIGDSIVWRTNGRIVADSVSITLKDGNQAWPFSGALPAGGGTVRSGAAAARGTFGYNVRLVCRMRGGLQAVTIDPDIIIE